MAGINYQQQFNRSYNKLNQQQKIAVDQIEGPVLVNAGPGTGKTQILAIRTGKILLEQDVAPHNILCLTYTDSAAIAMRQRLLKFIGPTAHQVHINTFHGFCNSVIQENLDIFGGYRQLEPITDLEYVDIFKKLIDALPNDNPLKRFKYDRYYEGRRMKHLFDVMKKENLSQNKIQKLLKEYYVSLESNEDYIYKKKYKNRKTGKVYIAGDLKEDNIKKEITKYKTLEAGIEQFENYIAIMDQASRYDFNDMILWVIKNFTTNEDLLLKYQERYQYFLVDEYQDTNGAQNDLLNLLISYWKTPNVFVVGDDDQAIYKFQGANLRNILQFQNQYNPFTVVLEKNYRSNQLILDNAQALIENNSERMIEEVPGLTKNLEAAGTYKEDNTAPIILSFEKQSHENAWLANELYNQFQSDPESLNTIAVIYRKHRQIEDLINVLEKLKVPLNIKRKINILEFPLIQNLINILAYLSEELFHYGDGQHRLFEILHYKYFNVDPLDVGKLALYCQKSDGMETVLNSEGEAKQKRTYPKWREVIADKNLLEEIKLKDPEKVLAVSQMLDGLMVEINVITLQTLFEKLINQGGVLNYIMQQEDKSWQLQILSTFFDLIKKESAKNPKLNINALLDMIKKMEDNDISLPINKIITSEKGVNFITAHSAKGLEFKKVFLFGSNKNIWNGKANFQNKFSFPNTINADNLNNIEDERRLFYVAMTRAEQSLIISYSSSTEEGKGLEATVFIDELLEKGKIEQQFPSVEEDVLANFYYKLLQRVQKEIPLIEIDLIDNWLEGYKLSVTHLNKYLRCPLSFYFESILKVPSARNAYTGYGTAMHHALNKFFENIFDPQKQDLERMLFFFEESLNKHRSHFSTDEYESYLTLGKMTLKTLHETKLEKWLSVPKYKLEEELANAVYKGVPLKGFIDKVEVFKDHVNVVDYKTGKMKSERMRRPDEKNEVGGDYWRQIVFYKMLLDSDTKNGWTMATGKIEYVEPDKKTGLFAEKEMLVTEEDLQIVGSQIVETYQNIHEYNFNKTCEDTKCRWCNFVNNNYRLGKEVLEEDHSYDEV